MSLNHHTESGKPRECTLGGMSHNNLQGWSESVNRLYARILHFGVSYGDLIQMPSPDAIGDSAWAEKMFSIGSAFEAQGIQCEKKGQFASLWELSRRATDYFHAAEMRTYSFSHRAKASERSRSNFHRFAKSIKNMKFITVSTRRRSAPGFIQWCEPNAPCIVIIGGLDSSKEVESFYFAKTFLDRGMSVVCIDFPGQGELHGELSIIEDFDAAVSDIFDYLGKIEGIAPCKYGIFGVSLGGYLALRASALEPRVHSCISLGGFYDYHVFERLQPQVSPILAAAIGVPVSRLSDEQQLTKISLGKLKSRHCKALIVHSSKDHLVTSDQIDSISKWKEDVEIEVLQGAEHVGTTRFSTLLPRLGDWMRDSFV